MESALLAPDAGLEEAAAVELVLVMSGPIGFLEAAEEVEEASRKPWRADAAPGTLAAGSAASCDAQRVAKQRP